LVSTIAVAMKAGPKIVGALSLTAAESGRRYDAHDLALAEELGRRAGSAVENARLYRAAQDAVRLRDDFLSIASHELKTPLTALALQIESLRRVLDRDPARGDERVRDRVGRIEQYTGRLERLIDQLLDVSRITAGRMVIDREKTDLAALVREVADRFESELARSGCELRLGGDAHVDGRWDRSRIDQILTNLISNAIKYAPKAPIDVIVRDAGDHAHLEVRDRGIGIDPEAHQRIFGRFERAVSDKNYGGFGLGLWIAKEIVVAHGGAIRFESEAGKGSVFIVDLPKDERPAG